MFEDHRDHIHQSCNEEGFGYLDQELIMWETADTYTLRSELLACATAIKKYFLEYCKRGYEVYMEGSYSGGGGG